MKLVLMALAVMTSRSFAYAAQYEGQNQNGKACFVTVQQVGKKVQIGLADNKGNTGLHYANKAIHAVDGSAVTYIVYQGNRVKLDVTVFDSGRITSTRYPMSRDFYCVAITE